MRRLQIKLKALARPTAWAEKTGHRAIIGLLRE
jgi:hypothetical protein